MQSPALDLRASSWLWEGRARLGAALWRGAARRAARLCSEPGLAGHARGSLWPLVGLLESVGPWAPAPERSIFAAGARE